jgi:dihydroceramidase
LNSDLTAFSELLAPEDPRRLADSTCFATMGILLPFISYPASKEGYWEPSTATINWCEEDYYATRYSAEIVNTLTNLLFIALGVKGIRNCLKYDHDNVFLVAFIGYIAVGSGSFAFHTTLKCE